MVSEAIPVETKKRGRPAGQILPESIPVRFATSQKDALDVAAAAEPDKPSRSELIRRIVAEWLVKSGFLPADDQIAPPSAATTAAKGADARSVAGNAADHAMTGMEATDEVKAQRRRVLTSEPEAVGKMRAKRAVMK